MFGWRVSVRFQSPQIGSLVKSEAIEQGTVDAGFQSPQIGSLVKFHKGEYYGKIYSFNPLKSGH